MVVFILFLILSVPLIYSTISRSLFEPAKIFTYFWIVQILMISFIFMNAYKFSGMGFLYILCATILFLLGSTFGKSLTFHLEEKKTIKQINIKRANLFLLVVTAIAFAYPFIKIARYGFGIQFLLNMSALFEMNNVIAGERYAGTEINTMSDQILLVFVYLSPLFAGYISTFANKLKWAYYLVFIPTLLVALTQSMKLGLIASSALWFAGKISSYFVAKKELPKLSLKNVLTITLILALFMGLLFFSMLLRTNEINADTINLIAYRFVNYSLGHMVAFDEWFTLNWNTSYPFELKTFYGISNLIGLGQRVQGVFEEFTNYTNDVFPEEMITNVYTTFRFWIEDFGIIGSLLYVAFYGAVSGICFSMIKKNHSGAFVITIYSAMFFLIFLSFATSVWAYTSYMILFVFYYLLLKFSYNSQNEIENE